MPPAPRLPSATGTTRARGLGFSTDETKALLRSIEKYLPIGGLEWDTVVSEHEVLFPVEQRTKEALKRKFAALHNKRIPTGDPHIPDSVRYAKRLIEEIKNKADISDGEDYDEEVPSCVQDASAHIIGKTNFSVPFTIRVRFVTNTNLESDTRVEAPLIVQATVVEQFDDPSDINSPPFGAGATVATALVTMAGRHDEPDDTGEAGTGSILVSSTGNHNRLVVRAGSTSTAFSRGPGARSFVALGSKKQPEAANSADGGMTKILEFMQSSTDTAERARKREFDAAERARKEELALIREQMQSSNMIMMQIMASITGGRQNEDRKMKNTVRNRNAGILNMMFLS